MRAWLVSACLSLCLAGCDQPSAGVDASAAEPALDAGAATHPDAGVGNAQADQSPSAASGFGGGNPSAAGSAPSLTGASASAAPSTALAAEPIPRGLVATDLAANPPRSVRGKPRGPIDTTQDGVWLRRMSHAAITKASQNKGGSTVTIRLFFEDGYRAVFKADQARSATNYRSEIVAYHLDRLLGFARTAPVVGRRINRAALRQLLVASNTDPDFLERVDDELRDSKPAGDHGAELRGALIAWHEKPLHSLPVPRSWTKWLVAGAAAPEAMRPHLAALAELTVFDYLLDNTDRWSGGNVLLLGPGGPMIFLDNGAGLADWRMQKELRLDADLAAVCTFPPGLVRSLDAVSPSRPEADRLSARLERSLRRDPLAPLLSKQHLAAIDQRLGLVLAQLKRCKQQRAQLAAPGSAAASSSSAPSSKPAPSSRAAPSAPR